MLTDLDPRVRAHINLYAVLGALGVLVRRADEARAILETLETPTSVTFTVRGLPSHALTFTQEGVTPGATKGARRITLAFTSADHFNAMIDGAAQPIPLAGPRGIAFLKGPFTELTDLLGLYLKPSTNEMADPRFMETSTVLTLHVAAAAIAQVANEDRSGRFSAASIPDGDIGLEVGDQIDLRLRAGPSPHVRRKHPHGAGEGRLALCRPRHRGRHPVRPGERARRHL